MTDDLPVIVPNLGPATGSGVVQIAYLLAVRTRDPGSRRLGLLPAPA